MFDFLIVGAGFSGSILAREIAEHLGQKVLVMDKRPHIGGNAYDYYDRNGILIHKYGPHIFHTNSKKVYDYLSKFTEWNVYSHRALASVDGRNVPIPINLDTINELYGMSLTQEQLIDYFDKVRGGVKKINNSEEVIVSKIGKELFQKFYQNYTKKQWDLDASELDPSVCARIPVRTNRDGRYFTDRYQVMPKYGYTEMFRNILNHPNIHVMLQSDFHKVKSLIPYKRLIYTGPIDAYFEFKYGKLPYRSLTFEFETHDTEYHQEVGQINYPNDYDFTRITEFKHLTGQKHPKTTIAYEYPSGSGDPYYPIPKEENAKKYQQYKNEADKLDNCWFIGRLGTYKYYNMDQVVAQALTLFENHKDTWNTKQM